MTESQVTDWEDIFANHIKDKGFAPRIYKKLLELNNKKTITQFKKWAKDVNRHFTKEEIQMANELVKRRTTPLITGRCNSKPQWDTTAHPWGCRCQWQVLVRLGRNWNPPPVAGGNMKWCSHCGRHLGSCLQTSNNLTICPSHPSPRHPLGEMETPVLTTTCTPCAQQLYFLAQVEKDPNAYQQMNG